MADRKPQMNTTIEPDLVDWMNEVYWKKRIPKTQLIDKALRFYRKHKNPLDQEKTNDEEGN